MTLGTLFDNVGSLRRLLAGETVVIDGKPVRMLHWPGMTAARPVRVPLWLSVMGPRGNERATKWQWDHRAAASNVADRDHDGWHGPRRRWNPRSDRALNAVGPWG